MNKDFGNWLRDKIKASGRNQAEFSELIGIEQPQLSRILSGTRGASNQVLENIANALGIPSEIVLLKAGILNPKPVRDEKIDEALHILNMLDGDDLEEIIQIARLKLERKPQIKKSRRDPARSVLIDK